MDIETSEALDRIGERIDALERSLRAEFREGLAQNRRHTEVLFESLRDDIRLLAGGFVHVSAKLDSLQR
jgi:hypothetical protein